MKKLKICSFLLLIIVSFTCFFLFFLRRESELSQSQSIKVVSTLREQIQKINHVRLDKIVIDIEYRRGHQNYVVTEEMLSEDDLIKLKEVGLHNITINYAQLKVEIPVMIYDESLLSEYYIYYYTEEQNQNICLARNINEVKAPQREEDFFYGWSIENKYVSSNKDISTKIVQIFPKWVKIKPYQIDFYFKDELIKRQYVIDRETIEFPKVDDPLFEVWDYNESTTTRDLRINGIYLEENQIIVRFHSREGECIGYQILEKGQDCTDIPAAPDIKNYVFYGWSNELKNLDHSLDCYPLYYNKDDVFEVNFYDRNGVLLQTKMVPAGQSVTYDYEENDFDYVAGYSKNLDAVYEKMDVFVYFSHYAYFYYINNTLFNIEFSTLSPEEAFIPDYVVVDGIVVKDISKWYWKKREGSKNVFDLTLKEEWEGEQ